MSHTIAKKTSTVANRHGVVRTKITCSCGHVTQGCPDSAARLHAVHAA